MESSFSLRITVYSRETGEILFQSKVVRFTFSNVKRFLEIVYSYLERFSILNDDFSLRVDFSKNIKPLPLDFSS